MKKIKFKSLVNIRVKHRAYGGNCQLSTINGIPEECSARYHEI